MSEPGYFRPLPPLSQIREAEDPARWHGRWWVNGLLLLFTLVTTTVYGAAIAACFYAGEPFNADLIWAGYPLLFEGNTAVLRGLMFSLPLLVILLAHELGHYVACRRSNVDATLPFFLPSPLLLGTFGAFIRIKSPIFTRRTLFDIGVSGPIAGFVVLVPFLVAGIAQSRVIPHIATSGDFTFGTPLLMRFVEWLRFPGNLLPVGQLDGGHILYALFGRVHKMVSWLFLLLLLPMAYFSLSWLFWAVILFILVIRHPLVYDQTPLNAKRRWIAAAAFAILVISLSLTPVSMR